MIEKVISIMGHRKGGRVKLSERGKWVEHRDAERQTECGGIWSCRDSSEYLTLFSFPFGPLALSSL